MFGLDGGGAVVLLFLVGGYLLPFFINAVLASSRGKSVVLMLKQKSPTAPTVGLRGRALTGQGK